MGFREVRIDAEALTEGFEGFNQSTFKPKRVSQLILNLSQAGITRQRSFLGGRRLAPVMPHLAEDRFEIASEAARIA